MSTDAFPAHLMSYLASPSHLMVHFVLRHSVTIATPSPASSLSAVLSSPRRTAHKFTYWLMQPVKLLTDSTMIEKFQRMGMPPGYEIVWFNLDPTSDIVAIGLDNQGRKQYRYSQKAVDDHAHEKFTRLSGFIDVVPQIRQDVNKILKTRSLMYTSPEWVTALAIKLMDVGHFRIGSEQYRDEHESFGVSNLMPKHFHVQKGGKTLFVSFKGKSGVRNMLHLQIKDHPFTQHLIQLKELAEKYGVNNIFHWFSIDENDTVKNLRPDMINSFLARYGSYSAKDWRTYAANFELMTRIVLFLAHPDSMHITLKERKVALKHAVIEVADLLHHTPSNCKKSYMYPAITDLYLNNLSALDHIYKVKASRSIDKTIQYILDHMSERKGRK